MKGSSLQKKRDHDRNRVDQIENEVIVEAETKTKQDIIK